MPTRAAALAPSAGDGEEVGAHLRGLDRGDHGVRQAGGQVHRLEAGLVPSAEAAPKSTPVRLEVRATPEDSRP